MEEARLTKVFSPVPAGVPRARWVVGVLLAQWVALPVMVPLGRWVVALPGVAPRGRRAVVVLLAQWAVLPAPPVRRRLVAPQDQEPRVARGVPGAAA